MHTSSDSFGGSPTPNPTAVSQAADIFCCVSMHPPVPGDTLGWPSRRGAHEGAGSGPAYSTVPHPGASTPGRVSQPRAAPASSRPLCSTLFRAPGAINRGSHSLGEPPPSLLGPPASPARRDRRSPSPRLSLEAGGDAGLVTARPPSPPPHRRGRNL